MLNGKMVMISGATLNEVTDKAEDPNEVLERMKKENPCVGLYLDVFLATLSNAKQRGAALTAAANVYAMFETELLKR